MLLWAAYMPCACEWTYCYCSALHIDHEAACCTSAHDGGRNCLDYVGPRSALATDVRSTLWSRLV